MTKVKMSSPFDRFTEQGFIVDFHPDKKDPNSVMIDIGGDKAFMYMPEFDGYSYSGIGDKDHDIYCEGPCAVISNTNKGYYQALISMKRSTTFHYHKDLTELVRVRKAGGSKMFIGLEMKKRKVQDVDQTELSMTNLQDGMILSLPPMKPHGFYVPNSHNLILELVTDNTKYEDTDVSFKNWKKFEIVAEDFLFLKD
ncbi:MAG: hypothetical protein GOV02_01835 [Candidatus Aenigmarchaeota archaeon]|nr:hypothetical protein [Candidatus Aenigmarchaeota archaeon]